MRRRGGDRWGCGNVGVVREAVVLGGPAVHGVGLVGVAHQEYSEVGVMADTAFISALSPAPQRPGRRLCVHALAAVRAAKEMCSQSSRAACTDVAQVRPSASRRWPPTPR